MRIHTHHFKKSSFISIIEDAIYEKISFWKFFRSQNIVRHFGFNTFNITLEVCFEFVNLRSFQKLIFIPGRKLLSQNVYGTNCGSLIEITRTIFGIAAISSINMKYNFCNTCTKSSSFHACKVCRK